MNKLPLVICLMGPTASGKTDLALQLTQHLPCSIISVDSALVYRGMDIGTAKPSQIIRDKIPHALIDILDPTEAYSAAQFRQDALQHIQTILEQQRIPLLVGGTMLYFKVLQQGISELPSADSALRQELSAIADTQGYATLHARLAQLDPAAAQRIHINDRQRIQRALEIHSLTGETSTTLFQQAITTPPPYRFLNIGLFPEHRTLLHERIAQRLTQMLEQGFINEVQSLIDHFDLHAGLPAIRTVGYRQIWDYLHGAYDYPTLTQKILFATRQLAKRQLTWLRSWTALEVVLTEDLKKMHKVLDLIQSKMI